MSTELSRKKRVRAGHRASTNTRTEDLMAADPLDSSKLTQLKMSLSEKLEVLKQLDSEILDQIEEDDVAAEIESSDNF